MIFITLKNFKNASGMLILSDDFHSYLRIYLECEKMFEISLNLKKNLNKKLVSKKYVKKF